METIIATYKLKNKKNIGSMLCVKIHHSVTIQIGENEDAKSNLLKIKVQYKFW